MHRPSHIRVRTYRLVLALTGALVITAGDVAAVRAQCISEASPYGINVHAPQGSSLVRLMDEVQSCGMGWIRIDMVWAWVEPSQDTFSWSIYDSIVGAARARGLHIFATISQTPAWATTGPAGTGVPTNAADYYDVCYRAATRYRDSIRHWGMWNEPNLSQFWSGSRAQYINLILNNGADAIHAASPEAKVCGPELAHLNSGSWDVWLTDCITQAGSRLDIVTHHVYGNNHTVVTDRLEKSPTWPWDPPSVKQVLQNTGWFGRPFWLTEVGWESDEVGEANQANYYTGLLNNWFTGQPARSWIHKVFFYELNDTQAFSQYSFGILGPEPAYARKAAFTAYQNFIAAHPAPPFVPAKVQGANPPHLAVDVRLSPAGLSWAPVTCATSYDVYFGTESPGVLVSSQTTTTYNPGTLARKTTYYWRIDTWSGTEKTTGDVWQFTTAGSPADFDQDDDVDQTDFGYLQRCLSGEGGVHEPDCAAADLDGDTDVDGHDVAQFLECMGGPDREPNC